MGATSLLDVDLDAFDRVMAVNIKGPFLCVRAVFPYMRDQGGGKIINIGSGSWLHTSRGVESQPHYTSSKAAVTGLTRALAKELGQHNITINTLAPGNTPPGLPEGSIGEGGTERALGRLGRPEDLAGAMVFLFSDDSDFMTAQMVLVNGGMETW
jgi:NAD(P)-dependent dehydrogenase (short-subunit alcohol dehydrogenase family)